MLFIMNHNHYVITVIFYVYIIDDSVITFIQHIIGIDAIGP